VCSSDLWREFLGQTNATVTILTSVKSTVEPLKRGLKLPYANGSGFTNDQVEIKGCTVRFSFFAFPIELYLSKSVPNTVSTVSEGCE
jgi:hypothetical protein